MIQHYFYFGFYEFQQYHRGIRFLYSLSTAEKAASPVKSLTKTRFN